jgi:effector protein SdbA
MAKQKLSLPKSENKYGGYYRLIPAEQTFSEQLKQVALWLISTPYIIYQTIVGRVLSFFVINPLFRKEEKDESIILQHPIHPDPLFSHEDEMSVINVIPKKHILIRALLNWNNFFINHMAAPQISSTLLNGILHLLPSGTRYINEYLDRLVEKVSEQILGENKVLFKPSQIHFRGIEQLSAEQQETLYEKLTQRFQYDFRQNRNSIYFYSLQTIDNAVLDSVEVRPRNTAYQEMSNRRFIIACMPQSINFVDWLKDNQIYAKELNTTIIAFNYRGIGLSKGIVTTGNDLYADAYAQVQRLLNLGVDPEHIALMGECLGGNVATYVAGTLHEEKIPVKLFNARSFRSATSIIEYFNTPAKDASLWHPITWLQWLSYFIIKRTISPVLNYTGWSLNIDRKFTVIPPKDRDYLVVRSKKKEQNQRFADDKLIPHKKASTYSLVKEKTKVITLKKQQGDSLSETEQQWLDDIPNQHKFYVSETLHTQARRANGHLMHPRLLISTNPRHDQSLVDGRQYMFHFFNRVWPNIKEDADFSAQSENSC